MKKLLQNGRKVMTVSVPSETYDAFIAICTKQNLNRSAIITSYLEKYVKRDRNTSAKK